MRRIHTMSGQHLYLLVTLTYHYAAKRVFPTDIVLNQIIRPTWTATRVKNRARDFVRATPFQTARSARRTTVCLEKGQSRARPVHTLSDQASAKNKYTFVFFLSVGSRNATVRAVSRTWPPQSHARPHRQKIKSIMDRQFDRLGYYTTQSQSLSSVIAGPMGNARGPPEEAQACWHPYRRTRNFIRNTRQEGLSDDEDDTAKSAGKCHANVISGLRKKLHNVGVSIPGSQPKHEYHQEQRYRRVQRWEGHERHGITPCRFVGATLRPRL